MMPLGKHLGPGRIYDMYDFPSQNVCMALPFIPRPLTAKYCFGILYYYSTYVDGRHDSLGCGLGL